MSHNITLEGVRFTDLNLLDQIVKDVSGGRATLDREAKRFRTYRGQDPTCDAVIRMSHGPHDVGLKLQGGAYVPVYDPMGLDRCLVPKGYQGYERGSEIGGVAQEYVLREAEYEAAQRGYSANRVAGKNGAIVLELVKN